jgi:hypothetical protein
MSTDDREVVLRRRTPQEQIDYLIFQVGLLTARVTQLESQRKGGRPAKKITVHVEGVCGVDPDRDSSTCPDASLYRRRQGCQGIACARASSEYYKERNTNGD